MIGIIPINNEQKLGVDERQLFGGSRKDRVAKIKNGNRFFIGGFEIKLIKIFGNNGYRRLWEKFDLFELQNPDDDVLEKISGQ